MIRVDWNPDRPRLRQFGLSLAGGATIAGGVSAWWPGLLPPPMLLWAVAAALAAAALLAPPVIRPLHRLLWGLTFGFFWITAAAVLAVIYYGLMTPIGLLLRLARKDSLGRRIEADSKSYWDRLEPPSISGYLKQF